MRVAVRFFTDGAGGPFPRHTEVTSVAQFFRALSVLALPDGVDGARTRDLAVRTRGRSPAAD